MVPVVLEQPAHEAEARYPSGQTFSTGSSRTQVNRDAQIFRAREQRAGGACDFVPVGFLSRFQTVAHGALGRRCRQQFEFGEGGIVFQVEPGRRRIVDRGKQGIRRVGVGHVELEEESMCKRVRKRRTRSRDFRSVFPVHDRTTDGERLFHLRRQRGVAARKQTFDARCTIRELLHPQERSVSSRRAGR